jgi:hypothetical protein
MLAQRRQGPLRGARRSGSCPDSACFSRDRRRWSRSRCARSTTGSSASRRDSSSLSASERELFFACSLQSALVGALCQIPIVFKIADMNNLVLGKIVNHPFSSGTCKLPRRCSALGSKRRQARGSMHEAGTRRPGMRIGGLLGGISRKAWNRLCRSVRLKSRISPAASSARPPSDSDRMACRGPDPDPRDRR